MVGAHGSLGQTLCRTLVVLGVQVAALVPVGAVGRLGDLRERCTVVPVDVWNPASLRGKSRGYQQVVHLVGGLKQDTARGMTFRQLNTVSSRNTVRMAVDDGVPGYVLLSSAARPFGVSPAYLTSKREAESYLRTSGLNWTMLRMPPLVEAGSRAYGLYGLVAAFAGLPGFNLVLGNHRPMSITRAAWGTTAAVLDSSGRDRVLNPAQIRMLGRALERRSALNTRPAKKIGQSNPVEDEPPFGWLP